MDAFYTFFSMNFFIILFVLILMTTIFFIIDVSLKIELKISDYLYILFPVLFIIFFVLELTVMFTEIPKTKYNELTNYKIPNHLLKKDYLSYIDYRSIKNADSIETNDMKEFKNQIKDNNENL